MAIQVGDIFWCNMCPEQTGDKIRKNRPVIVVKCDHNSTLLHIVPLTGNLGKPKNLRHIKIEGYGLSKPSMTLIEQVCLVEKASLGNYIGCIHGSKILEEILTCLAKYFKPDAA